MTTAIIHPTAIVHSTAKLGDNVKIGPFAVIGEDVVIGDRSDIGAHVMIEFTEMGHDCRVFPFAAIGLPPQHLQYKGEKTKVSIGQNCVIREGVTIHRGTPFDQGLTAIGDNCFFMAYAHVAHDCRIGDKVIMANSALLAGHVEIGDNCFLSATSAVHQFVRVGKGTIVSGGAMVSMDTAPFCVAQGDRARIRGINLVGLKRMGISKNSIRAIKNAYRTVFHSNLTLTEALVEPSLLVDDPHVATFRDFFRTQKRKRGFLRPSDLLSNSEAKEYA